MQLYPTRDPFEKPSKASQNLITRKLKTGLDVEQYKPSKIACGQTMHAGLWTPFKSDENII